MKYLIDFVQSSDQAAIDAYLTANNATVVKTYNAFEKVFLVEANSQPLESTIVESIVNDTESRIEPLSAVQLFQTSKTKSLEINDEKNWWKVASIYDIDFSKDFYQHKVYGELVNIYVVDSGIDSSHPEFTNQNINLLWSFTGEFGDTNGHGTAISSLLVGNQCGLTDASVKVVKIFDNNTPTMISHLIEAFDNIIADYSPEKYAVVNLSWGIPKNTYVEAKIRTLISLGIVVIAAAGNSGTVIDNITPAGMPEVVTVGAYNDNFLPCDFTNYTSSELTVTQSYTNGGALDVWAPGEKIWVALPNGQYGYVAGTSFSAAIFSGALAYDMDLNCLEVDGTFPVAMHENRQNFPSAGFCISRKGILTLTGQYSNSVNMIATYAGDTLPNISLNNLPPYISFGRGFNHAWSFISSAMALSIEVSPALPEGLTLSQSGIITGTIPPDENAEDIEFKKYTLTIVARDQTVITHDIDFVIFKNYDLSLLNIPEEYANITLFGVNCNAFSCNAVCPAGINFPSSRCVIEFKGFPVCPVCSL